MRRHKVAGIGCNTCTANKPRTSRIPSTSPQVFFLPSLTYNGCPSLQMQRPSLSVPSSSSPSLSVVGYGQRTSGGPSQDMPSSWTCCAASQVGLSLPQSQTQGFPDHFHQSPLLHSQPLPLTSGCALPLGGHPCPRPTNFRPLPNTGFSSCHFPSSLQLSTTEDTNPSASVGFLAAGGTPSIPSAVKTPFHTGHEHNLSSGNLILLNLTPRPTLLNAGAQGLVNPPERLPVWSPLSQQLSDTILPVLSLVQGCAEPLTRTLSSPRSPSTSWKKRSTLLEDKKNVRGP